MSQMITDVTADKQQGLMMLTHPEGVTVFDTKQDTLYYIRRSGDLVKGMARDNDGTYWLCTTSGSVVGITPLDAPRGGKSQSRFSVMNYMPGVGMPQFYFNGDAMTRSP